MCTVFEEDCLRPAPLNIDQVAATRTSGMPAPSRSGANPGWPNIGDV